MATYYFLGGGIINPTDWNDTSNWYDAPSSGNNGYLPTNSDDVVILSDCNSNGGSTPTVNSLTIDNCTFSITCSAFSCLVVNSAVLDGNITMTSSNQLTVTTSAKLGSGNTITGNVNCADGGIIGNSGSVTITGNLTFGSTGTVDSNSSTNAVVSGNLIIDASFTGSVDYITANNVIYIYGYTGTISNLTLSGSSPNAFYSNYPTMYYNAAIDGDWSNRLNWWVDSSYTQQANEPPTGSTNVEIFNDVTTNSLSSASANNLTIGGNPGRFIDISITINGTADFNDYSYYGTDGDPSVTLTLLGTLNLNDYASIKNNATIDGNAVTVNFYDSSTNTGTITSTVNVNANYPLNRNTFNTGTINGTISYVSYQTFYFNSGNDWYTLGNWYLSDLTTQAPYIPGSLDDVVLRVDPSATSADMYANNVQLDGITFTAQGYLYVTSLITITNSYLGSSMYSVNIDCANATFDGGSYIVLNSAIVATGTVTFNDSSELGSSTISGSPSITGDVEFRDSSEMVEGSITGDVSVFDSSTLSNGTIIGDITFNSPSAINKNSVSHTGDTYYVGYSARTVYYYHNISSDDWGNLSCWWDDSSHSDPAEYVPNGDIALDNVIIEAAILSNISGINVNVNDLVVSGSAGIFIGIDTSCTTANFFDDSIFGQSSGTLIQNDSVGNITFHDLSSNQGTIIPSGLLQFRDSSTNDGLIIGNAEVYYPSEKPIGGSVSGTVTYYGYTLYFGGSNGDWNDSSNWFTDVTLTNAYNDIPSEIIPYQDVVIVNDLTNSTGGDPTAFNLTNYFTYTNISGISINVYGLATLINEARLNAPVTISGNVLFEDLATNRGGTITGTTTFELTAATEMIASGYDGTYGTVEFKYGKGVNGSNILGIV